MLRKSAKARGKPQPSHVTPLEIVPTGIYATFIGRNAAPPCPVVFTSGGASTLDAIEQTAKDALNRWGAGGKDAHRGAVKETRDDGKPFYLAPPAVWEASTLLNLIRQVRAGGVDETDRDRVLLQIGALGERLIVRQSEHLAATGRSVHVGGAEGADVRHGPKPKRDAIRAKIRAQFEALHQAAPTRKLTAIDREVAESCGLSARTVRRYRAH